MLVTRKKYDQDILALKREVDMLRDTQRRAIEWLGAERAAVVVKERRESEKKNPNEKKLFALSEMRHKIAELRERLMDNYFNE